MSGWQRQGFHVVPGLLSPDEVRAIERAVWLHARKIRPDGDLIELRKDKAAFSQLYDTLQSNAVMQGALLSRKVIDQAAELLGDPPETLSMSGMGIRLDAPQDKRNALGWHQERSYYDQNEDGRNGLVVWVALQDVDEINGGVLLKPGSHHEGFIPTSLGEKGDSFASDQYEVPPPLLERYPTLQIKAKAGTGVFFNMNLMHASAPNVSERIRMTLQGRIHRALADDFRPGRNVWK